MRTLKITLGAVYVILIILLLLSAKGCNRTVPAPEVPIDTSDVVRKAELIGQNGALKVTLLWDFPGDIDLHVMQPNGNEIFYQVNKDASTGGFLDVDDIYGGNGSAENIFWRNPLKGEYKISLVYYQPSRETGETGAGTCTVVVFQHGRESKKYNVYMSRVKETKEVVTITVD